jgi:hypothetical protein
MCDPDDFYQVIRVVNQVHDAVIPDPDPAGVRSFDLGGPGRLWLILQSEKPPPDPPGDN